MPDYSLPSAVTLIFGRSGSGKSTFAFRYLLNAPAACRFIFDWKGEAASRLKLKSCGTIRECEEALATRWVCFNPLVMFEERQKDALRWFCHWAYLKSMTGPGKKILFVDELWKFVDGRNLPAELEKVARMGRVENLELCTATQHPKDYHRDISAEVTEWVCFNMIDPDELKAVRPYYRGVERASQLSKGEFLAYNVESGAELAGRVF